MSALAALKVSREPAVALAIVGVFWGSFAALVPDLKAQAGASDAAFGVALLGSATGGMIVMALAPRLMRALGMRALPVFGALAALALLGLLAAGSVPGLFAALLGMGLTIAALDVSANVRISEREARHGMHLMNVNHAMFSFAFGAAALLVSLARKAGFGPAEVLPVAALVCAAMALLTRGGEAPQVPNDKPGKGHPIWGAILPAAAILFASFVCENATEAWSALHIERTLGGPHGDGGFGPMALGLTMGLGRLAGQYVAERIGEARLVALSAALGTLGAVIIAAAPAPWVVVLGVGVLGLGVAVVVPSANSLLGHRVADADRAYAISRAWMLGFTGFFIGPSAMGFIAEHAGLRLAFVGVAVVMASIVVSVRALDRRALA